MNQDGVKVNRWTKLKKEIKKEKCTSERALGRSQAADLASQACKGRRESPKHPGGRAASSTKRKKKSRKGKTGPTLNYPRNQK